MLGPRSRGEYAAAVGRAVAANAAYYGDGDSPLDDDEYDRLARGIAAYEDEFPEHVLPDSPTGKVAGGALTGDVPHEVPMLSLDNVFSEAEVTEWVAWLSRRLDRPVAELTVEPKLDGLAVAVRYHRGLLTRILTRGDGVAGEDVSHAIGMVTGLPRRLPTPTTIEVRGEVLFTREQFAAVNEAREAPFTNPRSGAAGTLRSKQRPPGAELSFFAYTAVVADDERSHKDVIEAVAKLGVRTTADTPPGLHLCASVTAVQRYVDTVAAMRAELPFDIDGVVIKVNSAADRREAGSARHAPRWAVAYKLAPVEKLTRLLEVEWHLGRTGVITPVAVLEPVVIDGVTIGRATLHSPAEVTRRDLMLGDHVHVYRAGDTIPQITAAVTALRTGDERPIVLPTTCPRCGSEIDVARWRCPRGRACAPAATIRHAAGRGQFDIEGLGDKLVAQLLASGLVADIADLFTLTAEQLLGLDRMGPLKTERLLANIDAARGRPLSRVLSALGVEEAGHAMAQRIARHFGTMAAIRAADVTTMMGVEGLGPTKAPVIVADLASLGPVIDKLAAAGVNLIEPTADAPKTTGPLEGMTIVVTGAMTGALAAYTRKGVHELIERHGGVPAPALTKTTALLVAGERAGSKRERAVELGVRVVTPDEFAALLD